MKKILALAFFLIAFPAWAQNPTCPTRPAGDSSNACASTAFATGSITNLLASNNTWTGINNYTNTFILGTSFLAAQPAQFNLNNANSPGDSTLAYFGINNTSRPANGSFISAVFGSTAFPYTGPTGSISLFSAAVDTGAGRTYNGEWHNYTIQSGTGGGVQGLLIQVTAPSTGTWVPDVGITGPVAITTYGDTQKGGFAFGGDISAAASGSTTTAIVGLEVNTQYAVTTTGSKVGFQIADQLNNLTGTSTNAGINIAFQIITSLGAYSWDTGIFCPAADAATLQCIRTTGTFIKTGAITAATAVDVSAGTFTNAWISSGLTIDGTGNIILTTIGKTLSLKQGANGATGTFTCVSASNVTVNNTYAASGDGIFFTWVSGTGAATYPTVNTYTASTSFRVACASGDTAVYRYSIIKNAA